MNIRKHQDRSIVVSSSSSSLWLLDKHGDYLSSTVETRTATAAVASAKKTKTSRRRKRTRNNNNTNKRKPSSTLRKNKINSSNVDSLLLQLSRIRHDNMVLNNEMNKEIETAVESSERIEDDDDVIQQQQQQPSSSAPKSYQNSSDISETIIVNEVGGVRKSSRNRRCANNNNNNINVSDDNDDDSCIISKLSNMRRTNKQLYEKENEEIQNAIELSEKSYDDEDDLFWY